MEPQGLLKLPAELLDRIYTHLDWCPLVALEPTRPDIFSLSLTCKRLRETVLPTLFRHVTLRLRWCNDVLLEPAVFRLRKEHPDLARHVRCVMIEVEYDQLSRPLSSQSSYDALEKAWARYQRDFDASSAYRPFVLDGGVENWLIPREPSGQAQIDSSLETYRTHAVNHYRALHASLEAAGGSSDDFAWLAENQAAERQEAYIYQQRRKERFAQNIRKQANEDRIFRATGQYPADDDFDNAGMNYSTPPPKDPKMWTERSRAKLRIDALALALSCVPPSAQSLILNAVAPGPDINHLQNLALAVTAETIVVLGSRLTSLSMLTREVTTHRMPADLLARVEARKPQFGEALHLTPEVLTCLTGLKTLRLSGSGKDSVTRHTRKELARSQYWSQVNETLDKLELWHLDADESNLFSFMTRFPNVRDIRLHHMRLSSATRHRPANMDWHCAQAVSLLQFAITFRRTMPQTSLCLHSVEHFHKSHVPAGAVRFITAEVCPIGKPVDDGRVQRLMQDFESFFPYWLAEESEVIDRVAQAKEFGNLIDQAMSSRFKIFD